MALENVKPMSWYQDWNNVLPRLGAKWQEGDDGPGGWFMDGEDGFKRIRMDDDGNPQSLNGQNVKLYNTDLAEQGYLDEGSPQDIAYKARVAQYGEGQGFGGDSQKYLDYVGGVGSQLVNDPVHGWKVKAGDPAKAKNPTPVAMPFSGFNAIEDVVKPAVMTYGAVLAAGSLYGAMAAAPEMGATLASDFTVTAAEAGAAAEGGASIATSVTPVVEGGAAAAGAAEGAAAGGAAAAGSGAAAGGALSASQAAELAGLQMATTELGTTAGMQVTAAQSEISQFLDAVGKWANANPILASTATSVAGGFIKGAMAPSPEEQANAVAKARAQSEKEIADAIRANNNLASLNLGRLKPSGRTIRQAGELPPGLVRRNM